MTEQVQEKFLVRFMKIGYWADFYIYPATAVILFLLGLYVFHVGIFEGLSMLVFGFCFWGVIEYFMHRFALHHAPLFKNGHDEHHKRPKLHIGTPFFITLPVYFLVAWLIALGIGYGVTAVLLAGFIGGYFGYLICHHVVHSKPIKPGTFWHRHKKFHDVHHYKQNVNFGVSWHIWDKVFGTYQR